MSQLALHGVAAPAAPDLPGYDLVLVMFSGGKDSMACLLHLLDLGVPRSRIELWHHDVDGREGSGLMDWPCTPSYCRAVARALGVTLYFSWREGGFEGEMDRSNSATGAVWFEGPGGLRRLESEGKPGTRGLFPQPSRNLSVRWCSPVVKIDVAARALRNDERFDGKRVLVVTGEAAHESPGRAKYASFEPHRCDLRNGRTPRHIDHWRPIKLWTKAQTWACLEQHRINPHPCYRLGWGRCSCRSCIFLKANEWASLRIVAPAHFRRLVEKERASGKTMDREFSLEQLADQGTPFEMDPAVIAEANDPNWNGPVILPPGQWRLPSGAFGESNGPT